jgi:4-amino-4-deoxy-L-arabinose transferase-like glycosyltransferase
MTSDKMEIPFRSFSAPSWIKWGLVILAFSVALVLRLYDLTDPPVDFHPARQYHSAIIARGLYTRWGGDYPDGQWQLNLAQETSEARIEPPILEYLTAFTYLAAGGEYLWIARIYSILFWLLGGAAVYLAGKEIGGELGSFIGVLYYLYLPFGVYASRSFQPDPLMVALTAFSIWTLMRWVGRPGWKRAIIAGLLCGAAILVKQVAIFYVLGSLAGMVLGNLGLRKALRSAQVWAMGILAVFPALLYNFAGVFVSGSLRGQYSNRFYPELWIDPGFYVRWIAKIDQTVGLWAFLLALLGVLLVAGWKKRAVMAGFFVGYILYGFTFAHHISTHDYYQLPLIPMVALGITGLAGLVYQGIRPILKNRALNLGLACILFFALAWNIWQARFTLKKADYRDVPQTWAQLSREMGGAYTPAVGLMEDDGASLHYYGYVLPALWTSMNDPDINGLAPAEFQRAFENLTYGKKYFIITDFNAFDQESTLKQFLFEHYPIFAQGSWYLIFDLFNPLIQEG